MNRFSRIKAADKRRALENAGNKCAFPGCGLELVDERGIPFGEFCHIEAYATAPAESDTTIENIIVLCPEHHRLIDFH